MVSGSKQAGDVCRDANTAKGRNYHLIDVSGRSKPSFILCSWPVSKPSPKSTVDWGPSCTGRRVGGGERRKIQCVLLITLLNCLIPYRGFGDFSFQLIWKGLKISSNFSLSCKDFLAQTCCFWSQRNIDAISFNLYEAEGKTETKQGIIQLAIYPSFPPSRKLSSSTKSKEMDHMLGWGPERYSQNALLQIPFGKDGIDP